MQRVITVIAMQHSDQDGDDAGFVELVEFRDSGILRATRRRWRYAQLIVIHPATQRHPLRIRGVLIIIRTTADRCGVDDDDRNGAVGRVIGLEAGTAEQQRRGEEKEGVCFHGLFFV